MTDALTLSYINLFAVLGALKPLCELDPQASALIANKHVAIGISVKNGPCATLHFENGKVRVCEGIDRCQIKLPFSSPEKFNGMIDGTVTPIPSKGFTKIGFLTGPFIKLTDILTKYLRPTAENLQNEEFYRISTMLMLHVIAGAVAQIGNQDKIGQASASYMVDGIVHLSIKNELATAIQIRDHRLTVLSDIPEQAKAMSYMEFADLHIARELFDGQRNAVASVGEGLIRIGGMISQVDNVNRILDRVSLYLA
jgi:hypothetical protein